MGTVTVRTSGRLPPPRSPSRATATGAKEVLRYGVTQNGVISLRDPRARGRARPRSPRSAIRSGRVRRGRPAGRRRPGRGRGRRAARALDEHRLLLAHRTRTGGRRAPGAAQVEGWVGGGQSARPAEEGGGAGRAWAGSAWYPGRPLLVTANDRDSGLYNGDTGVVVFTPHFSRAESARGLR